MGSIPVGHTSFRQGFSWHASFLWAPYCCPDKTKVDIIYNKILIQALVHGLVRRLSYLKLQSSDY
jgi:hypothetical protein